MIKVSFTYAFAEFALKLSGFRSLLNSETKLFKKSFSSVLIGFIFFLVWKQTKIKGKNKILKSWDIQ